MDIQVIKQSSQKLTNHTAYYTTIVVNGKKEVSVNFAFGRVNVIYKNASHKAYRGFGKDFKTFEDAINNYKDSKIIAAIKTAQEIIENEINKDTQTTKESPQEVKKNNFVESFGTPYQLPQELPLNVQLYVIEGSQILAGFFGRELIFEYYKILKILLL